ncbi:MAG: DUF1565 domain-containing protein, partial [Phycisphaerae bacterium]
MACGGPGRAPARRESRRGAAARGLTALALICGTAPGLGAAELVVSPGGDDADPGSPQRPFRTIQKAADVIKPGDVCRIRGGLYRETVEVKASGRA